MYRCYDSSFRNDAMRPKMQSVFCVGKNVVKGSHLSRAFQALEEEILPSCPEVAMDTWIFPQPFPRCALCCELAKKVVVCLMW